MLDELYVHLPHKRAARAIDPLQHLRLLRARIPSLTEDRFHDELRQIFRMLRDLHTSYLPPGAERLAAALPVRIERYVDEACTDRFVISAVDPARGGPDLVGAEVTHWNGTPIATFVTRGAETVGASNESARRAWFLLVLTVRPLELLAPPDEEWVELTCRTEGGDEQGIRLAWQTISLAGPTRRAGPAGSRAAASGAPIGVSLQAELARETTRQLFAPQGPDPDGIETTRPELSARVVRTAYGAFGHLRIGTFTLQVGPDGDPGAAIVEFLAEVRRLLAVLPPDGLVLDVRGNPGGYITAAEGLLQYFSPRPIRPAPFQFRPTRTTGALAAAGIGFEQWLPSIEGSTGTGAPYSGAFPLTSDEEANAVGQVYPGPVVLVVDGTCYSAADILAAGFQDHDLGPVLGVDPVTGAGGASVAGHSPLGVLFGLIDLLPDGPLEPLPGGANFVLSYLRCLRVGVRDGQPLEELGVRADAQHGMTRRDLLDGNPDLMESAAALLAASGPPRRLDVTAQRTADGLLLGLVTAGLTGVDVYAGARPVRSMPVTDGTHVLDLPAPPDGAAVRVDGFAGDDLVASRRLPPPDPAG